ncbi:hypothetical protein, partial [Fischerella thermalis]|uniref:hypothetical protein n=1 Tax=Fischerella thermalis TaxID=372787 RepID=UPI001CA4D608
MLRKSKAIGIILFCIIMVACNSVSNESANLKDEKVSIEKQEPYNVPQTIEEILASKPGIYSGDKFD